MAVRILNLDGSRMEPFARAAVPEVEILTVPVDDVPNDLRADVMFSTHMPRPVHDRLDEIGIRWMHLPNTGIEDWPSELLRGRIVTCGRGLTAVPISEYVLAAILAFVKQVPESWIDAPPNQWNQADHGELSESTVAIVGLGGIGEAVATRAQSFGCRVRAYRRHPELGAPDGVELAPDLEDLFASADHLVIAAPATPATEHLLDAQAFAVVKPGVHVVNIARGSLIDQDALREALDDGRVARATLDTVTPEPLPAGHWLYSHPRVRVSPHVSWSSPRQIERSRRAFADNLVRYVAGEPLVGVVDADEHY